MKRLNRKLDEFNIFGIIFTNHEEAFEGNTEIITVKDDFMAKKAIISGIITKLSKPKTEVFGIKKDSRNQLRSSLKLAIGTGITVAKKQQNTPLLLALKSYRSSLSKTNTHDLPEMAGRVYAELKQNETIATGAGLSTEKLTALKNLISSFREIIDNTGYEFSSRKTGRKEANRLVTICSDILKDEMDTFVGHCKDEFPDFYNAYTTAREPRKSRKKKSVPDTTLADISGTVTNSVTSEPVANAIINLLATETVVTTDEDGYFSIDEVIAGTYTIGCHAPGYLVPDSVKADPKAGESLVIDFSLVPEPVIPSTE